jgi:hypothetical protein
MKKEKIAILILAVLLVLTISYIGFSKYGQWKLEKETEMFRQGAQYGYEQAVVQIVQQAASCSAVPLRVGNQTMSIIAVDCLTQAVGGGNGSE